MTGPYSTTMPKRESALMDEVKNKKVLQDEQIRNALNEYQKLLYYVSGGKELPTNPVKDVVRAEDFDLRGWFTQAYGKDYLGVLTSSLENIKDSPERVNQIITDFNTNDYGFALRVGALNEYHLGRIITHAENVYTHRREASAYSREMAILCSRILFSGEAPPTHLFTTLHTSIAIWYDLNSLTLPQSFEASLAKDPYHTYVANIVFALFDMHKSESKADNWHTYAVPGTSAVELDTLLSSIDGVGQSDIDGATTIANTLNRTSHLLQDQIDEMVADGYSVKPKYTAAIKTGWEGLDGQGYFVQKAIWRSLEEAGLKVGDELLSGTVAIKLLYGHTGTPDSYANGVYTKGDYRSLDTKDLWINYDTWIAKSAEYTAARDQLTEAQAQHATLVGADKDMTSWYASTAHNTYTALSSDNRAAWVNYVYARVKSAYNFTWTTALRSPNLYPTLTITPVIGSAISSTNFVDIGKTIFFYAKALQGLSPAAYWTACLSKRLVTFEKRDENDKITHTEVWIYDANMNTGGISTDSRTYNQIGAVLGAKESSLLAISVVLPEVPLYAPGVNENLPKEIKDTYTAQLADDPTLKQWLRSTQKSRFSYAYVINSAWDMGTTVEFAGYQFAKSTPPLPMSYWHRAGDELKSIYKGIKTFAPTKDYLKMKASGGNGPLYKVQNPAVFEGKGTLSATEMTVIAYPKATIEKILKFIDTVPIQIRDLLNKVNNTPQSGWYNANLNQEFSPNQLYGDIETMKGHWPYFTTGARESSNFQHTSLLNHLEPLRLFLKGRTESLFISNPGEIIGNSYKALHQGTQNRPYPRDISEAYDRNFGDTYYDYFGLLGTISYLNSQEFYTDTGHGLGTRTYPQWCQHPQVKAIIDANIGRITAGVRPMKIYSTQINDTEDVVKTHKILDGLKAFEGMMEMPVFDVKKFTIKWQVNGTPVPTPFKDGTGFPDIPVNGLQADAYPSLSNTYGDVFYQTIMDTCVMQPSTSFNGKYGYSKVRIPVNAKGVDGKAYGLRSGTIYTLGAERGPGINKLPSGSTGLTYTQLGVGASVLYIPVLAYLMYRNFGAGYQNQTWKTFD